MTQRCPSIVGGSWINGGNAGSRYANLGNWPENSNENLSARGGGDDPFKARRRSRPRRQSSTGAAVFMRVVPGWSARLSGFGEHIAGSGEAGSSGQAVETRDRQAGIQIMGKKHRNLISIITSDTNMRRAFRLTSLGKRLTPGFLEFKEFSILNLHDLAAAMRDGTYRPGAPRQFRIFDPKVRLISALPFEDRVAQHALCAVIGPIFEATLLPRTYACRPGKDRHFSGKSSG